MPVSPPTPQALGRTVRAHRQRLGLSIEALADQAALHPTYLSDIELGKSNPSLSKIGSLAMVFGLRVSTLIAEAEEAGAESSASA